jgi:hypothetical protein
MPKDILQVGPLQRGWIRSALARTQFAIGFDGPALSKAAGHRPKSAEAVSVRRPLLHVGNVMLMLELSEEIRGCLRHAEECARKARCGSSPRQNGADGWLGGYPGPFSPRCPVRACLLVSSWLPNRATMSRESPLTQSGHSVRQALTAYKQHLPDPADPRFGCVLSTPQRQTPRLMSALRRVCGRRLVQG